MKPSLFNRIAASVTACCLLSACQTVKMPKIDLLKSPEFSEDAGNISKSFPQVKDAPLEPDDIRSDAQWDKDVRALQSLRALPNQISSEVGLSEAEAEAHYIELKSKAQAYKQDDPETGPVEGFPEYKSRR